MSGPYLVHCFHEDSVDPKKRNFLRVAARGKKDMKILTVQFCFPDVQEDLYLTTRKQADWPDMVPLHVIKWFILLVVEKKRKSSRRKQQNDTTYILPTVSGSHIPPSLFIHSIAGIAIKWPQPSSSPDKPSNLQYLKVIFRIV